MDNKGKSAPEPKSLKRIVDADSNLETYHGKHEAEPSDYHGKHEAEPSEYHGKHEAEPSEYHGKHEAEPSEYHGKHEAEPSEYHGKHEAEPSEYHGKHEAEPSKYNEIHNRDMGTNSNRRAPTAKLVYNRPGPEKNKNIENDIKTRKNEKSYTGKKINPWFNAGVKVLSIVTSLILSFALFLNLPILADNENGKNISVINYIKNLKPAAKEGELNKDNVQLNIDSENIDDDFNDGLDLPQLIEGQYSILFLGFEPDEYNTDVMWIIQFDIGHGQMNILQIPRDTCLPDYTSSVTRKFNSIYTMGDKSIQPPIQRVVNAVQENFGIPIDAYVTTTCPDVVKIVDLIGGIPMHLDKEIDFEPSAPGTKVIPAGDIVLTGEQAEWFIRFRSGWLNGDLGRVQNQRRFMAAAMNKLMNIIEDDGRLKLYSYIKQIYDKDLLYTDLSVGDLGKVADFASTISMEDAHVNMVPGEDAKFYAADGNIYSVYSVHKQETIDLLNKYYRPYQKDMGWDDTSIVELVTEHQYSVYDDTGATLEELEKATEPIRK